MSVDYLGRKEYGLRDFISRYDLVYQRPPIMRGGTGCAVKLRHNRIVEKIGDCPDVEMFDF